MKLLLPYAKDKDGNLVHINDAQKGKYTCPYCSKEVQLRISRLPEEQKNHRRSHFAHKGNPNNNCSESYLHLRFKEKCAEFIKKKINEEDNLYYQWQCENCCKIQIENLLEGIADVETEYDLKVCKPDIALLDKNRNVVSVIEVIVSHKPEEKVISYYKEHNIRCLQISISDWDECEDVENVLTKFEIIKIIHNQLCDECRKDVSDMHNKNKSISRPNKKQTNSDEELDCIRLKLQDKVCPCCGRELVVEQNELRKFYRCENYPNYCTYISYKIDVLFWPDHFSPNTLPPADRN